MPPPTGIRKRRNAPQAPGGRGVAGSSNGCTRSAGIEAQDSSGPSARGKVRELNFPVAPPVELRDHWIAAAMSKSWATKRWILAVAAAAGLLGLVLKISEISRPG